MEDSFQDFVPRWWILKQGWVKSPSVIEGYLGNAEATATTITSDGFLYIVDRIKELIKHNGYQVPLNSPPLQYVVES